MAGEGLEAPMTGDLLHGGEGGADVGGVGAGDNVVGADGVGDGEGGLGAVGGELGAGDASDVVEPPGVVGEDGTRIRAEGFNCLNGDERVEGLGRSLRVRGREGPPVAGGDEGGRDEDPAECDMGAGSDEVVEVDGRAGAEGEDAGHERG